MATILYLTRVEFGAGLVASVRECAAELGMHRPLLVGDQGIKAVGLFDQVARQFEGAPDVLDVPSNPTEEAVEAALVLYRQERCL